MKILSLVFAVLTCLQVSTVVGVKKCVNRQCTSPISVAKAQAPFRTNGATGWLELDGSETVIIFGKDEDQGIWEASLKGKRGAVMADTVKEITVYHRKPSVVADWKKKPAELDLSLNTEAEDTEAENTEAENTEEENTETENTEVENMEAEDAGAEEQDLVKEETTAEEVPEKHEEELLQEPVEEVAELPSTDDPEGTAEKDSEQAVVETPEALVEEVTEVPIGVEPQTHAEEELEMPTKDAADLSEEHGVDDVATPEVAAETIMMEQELSEPEIVATDTQETDALDSVDTHADEEASNIRIDDMVLDVDELKGAQELEEEDLDSEKESIIAVNDEPMEEAVPEVDTTKEGPMIQDNTLEGEGVRETLEAVTPQPDDTHSDHAVQLEEVQTHAAHAAEDANVEVETKSDEPLKDTPDSRTERRKNKRRKYGQKEPVDTEQAAKNRSTGDEDSGGIDITNVLQSYLSLDNLEVPIKMVKQASLQFQENFGVEDEVILFGVVLLAMSCMSMLMLTCCCCGGSSSSGSAANQINQLKAQLEKREQEARHANQMLSKLKANPGSTAPIADAAGMNGANPAEVAGLQNEVQHLRNQLENMSQGYQQDIQSRDMALQQKEAIIAQKDQELQGYYQTYESERTELVQRTEEAEGARDGLERQIGDLQYLLDEERKRFRDKEEEFESLKIHTDTYTKINQALKVIEAKNEELESKWITEVRAKEAAKDRVLELQSTVKSLEHEVSALMKEREQKETSSLTDIRDEAREIEFAKMSKKLQVLEEYFAEDTNAGGKHKDAKQLRMEMAQVVEENAELGKKLEKAKETQFHAEDRMKKAHQEADQKALKVDMLENEIRAKQERLDTLEQYFEDALARHRRETEKHVKEIEKLETLGANQEMEMNEVREELEKRTDDLNVLTEDYVEVRNKYQELDIDVQGKASQIFTLQSECEEANERLEKTTLELADTRAHVEDLEGKVEEFRVYSEELEQTYNTEKDRADGLAAELHETEYIKQELQENVSGLRRKLAEQDRIIRNVQNQNRELQQQMKQQPMQNNGVTGQRAQMGQRPVLARPGAAPGMGTLKRPGGTGPIPTGSTPQRPGGGPRPTMGNGLQPRTSHGTGDHTSRMGAGGHQRSPSGGGHQRAPSGGAPRPQSGGPQRPGPQRPGPQRSSAGPQRTPSISGAPNSGPRAGVGAPSGPGTHQPGQLASTPMGSTTAGPRSGHPPSPRGMNISTDSHAAGIASQPRAPGSRPGSRPSSAQGHYRQLGPGPHGQRSRNPSQSEPAGHPTPPLNLPEATGYQDMPAPVPSSSEVQGPDEQIPQTHSQENAETQEDEPDMDQDYGKMTAVQPTAPPPGAMTNPFARPTITPRATTHKRERVRIMPNNNQPIIKRDPNQPQARPAPKPTNVPPPPTGDGGGDFL
eukprot:Clim_evm49s55 gene=Clim_evmTU49s55